ncbi:MAG: hypothetical protein ABR559_07430 [Gemmatimonadota bacterium]
MRGGIDGSRVLLGGLAAGLIINISETVLNGVVISEKSTAAMQALNLAPVTGGDIAMYVAMGFALGILLVWLYAAMRPRLGPGPWTAMKAGFVAWFLIYVWSFVNFTAMGLFPTDLNLISTVWGFFEIMIASLVGGWVYREV